MSHFSALSPAILGNTQTPHQPYLIIQDSSTCSGVPVVQHMLRKSLDAGSNIVLVSVLHSPEALGLEDIKRNEKIQSLDLTQHVPGYNHTSAIRDMEGIRTWILSACERAGRGVQVFIDAIDILAEDYGTASGAIKLVKDVVKCLSGLKAPSRLVLLLPTASGIVAQLINSSTTSTLSSIVLHPPEVVNVLASTYLFNPPTSGDLSEAGTAGGSRFRGLLENATKRNENLRLALSGEASAIIGDWSDDSVPFGQAAATKQLYKPTEKPSATARVGVVLEILVRKAAGGASKGMLRSLEGLRPPIAGKAMASPYQAGNLEPCRWQDIKALEGIAAGYQSARPSATTDEKPKEEGKAHVDSTFNLGLTEAQRASRAEVPIPYAHEGDDAPNQKRYDTTHTGAGIIFEPESDDDVDDDDPDDDLDF